MNRTIVLAVVAGLSLPAAGSAASLAGKWQLDSLENVPSFDAAKTELAFQVGGRVAMTVGCNRMSAIASADDAALKFGPVIATRMMCQPALMGLEAAFQNVIGRTAGFKLDGDKLSLVDGSNTVMATFTRRN